MPTGDLWFTNQKSFPRRSNRHVQHRLSSIFQIYQGDQERIGTSQGQSRAAHSTIGETGNYEHNQPNKTSRKILLARLNDALHLNRFIVRADDSLTEFWISNDAIALATNDRNACC